MSRRVYTYDDGHDIQHEMALEYMSLVDGRKELCLNPKAFDPQQKLSIRESNASDHTTAICKVVVLSKGYDSFETKEKA